MKLMIIDKQPQKRTMIRNFLNMPGITFCECDSGDEALAQVRKFKPDWITLDLNLLEADGFQSAAALREAHPPVQMVIVTGCNEADFNKLYSSVGRSAFPTSHARPTKVFPSTSMQTIRTFSSSPAPRIWCRF